jgi:hypothetical protein
MINLKLAVCIFILFCLHIYIYIIYIYIYVYYISLYASREMCVPLFYEMYSNDASCFLKTAFPRFFGSKLVFFVAIFFQPETCRFYSKSCSHQDRVSAEKLFLHSMPQLNGMILELRGPKDDAPTGPDKRYHATVIGGQKELAFKTRNFTRVLFKEDRGDAY